MQYVASHILKGDVQFLADMGGFTEVQVRYMLRYLLVKGLEIVFVVLSLQPLEDALLVAELLHKFRSTVNRCQYILQKLLLTYIGRDSVLNLFDGLQQTINAI